MHITVYYWIIKHYINAVFASCLPINKNYRSVDILYFILDIPNCMINDHNCTQVCVELEGSFNCSCYSGYQLQQDRATCEGS